MRRINLFFFLLLAPVVGVCLGLTWPSAGTNFFTNNNALLLPFQNLEDSLGKLDQTFKQLQGDLGLIETSVKEQQQQYEEQQAILQGLVEKVKKQRDLSAEVYEEQILAKLGETVDVSRSDKAEILVFPLIGQDYRGYLAKAKLFDPEAVKVALAKGVLGESETTLEAVRRTGAVLGINGGGFYQTYTQGEHQFVPLGNTIVDGNLIGKFSPSHDDLFFSGFTSKGHLIGEVVQKKEDLLQMRPKSGVSFVPVLLKDGFPRELPEKWRNEKHPRTVLGQYANGDLVFLVVDGRQPGWSSGVTLETLQIKLLELGLIDAYNLDGGGSSTFVFKGNVLNRPSDGKVRPVATHILVFP